MSDNTILEDETAEELGLGKKHLGSGLAKLELTQAEKTEIIQRYNELIADAVERSKSE